MVLAVSVRRQASCLLRALRASLVCSALLIISVTLAQSNARADTPAAVSGQYLIKFATNTQTNSRKAVRASLGVKLVKSNPLTGSQLVEARERSLNDTFAKELLASGAVEYIEPNYIYSINNTPNDSRFSELWGMHNERQTGGTSDVDIDAPSAWDLTQGSNDIVVGVVDTGIAYTHPDLAANMWHNPGEIPGNGIDDDHNGVADDYYGYNAITNSGNVMDDNGHGTHTSGTIGAAGGNGTGVVGVNWNVKLMPLKFLDASGNGSTQGAIAAIEYAIRMKQAGVNIKVLNNSWGGGSYSAALEDAISLAAANGILFVAAAGNAGNNNDNQPTYPANYRLENVISVAAVDSNGNLASFSNYGAQTVDLAAPGVNILSTLNNGSYGQLSGTSMATPHVAGVAALVLARESSLSVSELRTRLVSTVKPLSSLNGVVTYPGIVSAVNALTNARAPLPAPAPAVNYTKKSRLLSFDSDLGTRIMTADDGYTEVALPFSFPYYRTAFTRLAVSANGRILPTAAGEDITSAPDYTNTLSSGICVFHDDLVPSPYHSELAGVWAKVSSAGATITWVSVPYGLRNANNSENEITVQAKLYPSGKIEFHYLDTLTGSSDFDYGASATVGLAPVTGISGEKLLVSQNTAKQSEIGSSHALQFDIDTGRATNDFDGDGKSDLAVWRPATGYWYLLLSNTGYDFDKHAAFQLGLPGDRPLTGDFDGDGRTDLAVWRPANGTWYFRMSASDYQTVTAIQWGLPGDTPLVGDFDGDEQGDLAVYRPQAGAFYALLSSGGYNRSGALGGNSASVFTVSLGGPANDPLVGDFNGDGRAEFAAIWQLIRFWSVKTSDNVLLYSLPWGDPGDTPLACDLDADGASDRVVVRVNKDNLLDWFGALANGGATAVTFASLGDLPRCTSDFDGDGAGDMAIFRPTSGDWYLRPSSTGEMRHYQFGLPGDIAL